MFNIKKYKDSKELICSTCGYSMSLRKASSCPVCNSSIFRIANRSGTPQMYDMDDNFNNFQYDPYARQKQKGKPSGTGRSDKLNTPGDEEGWSGLGTRWRGKDAPKDVSSSDEYEEQLKDDIPTSHDTNIDNEGPGYKTDLQSWFADPSDPLSVAGEAARNVNNTENPGGPSIDSRLQKQRGKSLRPRLTDDVFSKVVKKQRGLKW